MMLDSDKYILDGTNLDEYHEYQQRITSQLSARPVVDSSEILDSLRGLGIDVDSVRGVSA
jgi:hypothetical protein